jgi:hypothetical protein
VLSSPVFANLHPQRISPPPPLCVLRERRLSRPGRGVKNSPPLHPGPAASPETAQQNIAKRPLQTASPRPPLHQNANSRPLFSTRCALFCNYGGGGASAPIFVLPISSFVFRSSLSPSESTLTDQHRVSPCFGRNRPPATPLQSALTTSVCVNSLESALTKNRGGGVCGLSYQLTPTQEICTRHRSMPGETAHQLATCHFPISSLQPIVPRAPIC